MYNQNTCEVWEINEHNFQGKPKLKTTLKSNFEILNIERILDSPYAKNIKAYTKYF